MFYIYARERGDLTRHYWNRAKNEWTTALTRGCLYPTRRGVDRIHGFMVKDRNLMGRRFNEIGWNMAGPGHD